MRGREAWRERRRERERCEEYEGGMGRERDIEIKKAVKTEAETDEAINK